MCVWSKERSIGLFKSEQEEKEQKYLNYLKRITPSKIDRLKTRYVYVFGTNLEGLHVGREAQLAVSHFGAEYGIGVGSQGKTYAIPTMQGNIKTVEPYIKNFVKYAKQHPEQRFYVTYVGCGISGFDLDDMGRLSYSAKDVENVFLPQKFLDEIVHQYRGY